MTQPRRYQDAPSRRITSRRCGHVAGVDLLVLASSPSRWLLVLRTPHRATPDYSHSVLRNAARLLVLRASLRFASRCLGAARSADRACSPVSHRCGSPGSHILAPLEFPGSSIQASSPHPHVLGAASVQAVMGVSCSSHGGFGPAHFTRCEAFAPPRRPRLVPAPEGHGCTRSSKSVAPLRGAWRAAPACRCSCFAHRNAERPAARIAERRNGHAKRERDARDAGSGSRSEPLTCGARCAARSASSEGSA